MITKSNRIATITLMLVIMTLASGCFVSISAANPFRRAAFSYTTKADKSLLMERKRIPLKKVSKSSVYDFALDTASTYQTVDGFGAAITWASCYNLLKMSQQDRSSFLNELFDPKKGLGIGLIRVTIGASDFNLEEYTWCDTPGIENFKVHPSDSAYLLPVLREIYSINPSVKIIASPWSCPRWMKQRSLYDGSDYYSWTGGSLKKACYQDYASYFVKWIKTMEEEGFDIYAMTVQNEPLNSGNSMSLFMTWKEQRDFIKNALGPAFKENGIDTKILVFDHNYNYDGIPSQQRYPLKIYDDAAASAFIAGSAWHNYGGKVSELDRIIKSAPDKEIYFTEASIGTWNYSFGDCLVNDFDNIFLQTLQRGCKGVTLWNMLLDENRWPFSPQKGSCKTCFGVATLQSDTAEIIDRTSHYYNIAHASKVIKPGAIRIGMVGRQVEGISCQAYKNPDGTFAVLLLNRGNESRSIVISDGKRSVNCESPERSILSIIWK